MRWLALLAALLAAPAMAADKIVAMAGIIDDIDPRVLDDFTIATGIAVAYDGFDTPAALETRVQAGKSGFDLVVLSGPALQRQSGMLQKLDKSKLPNLAGLWPAVAGWQGASDPGLTLGASYQWYATGLAFDVARARERLGEAGVASWDVLFRPEILRKFNDCGVEMLDSVEDLMPVALASLKLAPGVVTPDSVRRAMEHLGRLRPQVARYSVSGHVAALVNGDACLAVSWTGEALQARNRARASKGGPEIGFAIPREGAPANLEIMAIPRDASHAAAALMLIDYLLRPDIAARNSTRTGLASAVLAAKALLAPDIAGDAAVYPDDALMKRLYAVPSPDAAMQKLMAREWLRAKTGK